MSRLIGLCGRAGAGKDALAGFLVREHGFSSVAFADPLRDMLYALNPTVVVSDDVALRVRDLIDMAGWDVAKRQFPEVRELLQRLGTDAGRKVLGETVWVDLGLARARAAGGAVVVTDCRFDNEALAVRAAGGEVWRVMRPGVRAVSAHVSENGISDELIDRTIVNDGSLSDLGYAAFGALL